MKTVTRRFSREFLVGELGLPYDADEGIVIRNEIIDTDRWSIVHDIIFKHDGKLYETSYSEGVAEMQDVRPWEFEDPSTCTEVEPVKKTITIYEAVKGELDDETDGILSDSVQS